MRCYDKEDDKTNLRSYRDDILDIAYYSLKEEKLLCIDFDESLISQYDKDMTRGTVYPVSLEHNVNAWNEMNVIVETIPDLCGYEDQSLCSKTLVLPQVHLLFPNQNQFFLIWILFS